MIVSIVTVVFNDQNHIEKTIESVLGQTYKSIQYIIIDGKSTDNTLQIIEKYRDQIDTIVSEPDKGLYDAMNKSMNFIKGDFVCFLNSGDMFNDNKTVENAIKSIENKKTQIIYGDTVIVDEKVNIKGKRRHRPPKTLNWKSFRKGMLVCHQAFWASKKILEPYNLNFKYSADFEWCIRLMKKSQYIHNTNQILIKFMDGGLTKKRMKSSLKERFIIMKLYYGLIPTLWTHLRNAFRMSWFYITKGWY